MQKFPLGFQSEFANNQGRNIVAQLCFEKPFEKDFLWFDPFIIFQEITFMPFD